MMLNKIIAGAVGAILAVMLLDVADKVAHDRCVRNLDSAEE